MLDRALYVLPVVRQEFGSVNSEFQIIEGQITEFLMYFLIIYMPRFGFFWKFFFSFWFSLKKNLKKNTEKNW